MLVILQFLGMVVIVPAAILVVPAAIVLGPIVGGYLLFSKHEDDEEGKIPLRQSLLLNPSTWVMGAIILAAIGLLIQYLNPGLFAEAALTMGIMQMVFLGLVGLTCVGVLLYAGYRAVSPVVGEVETFERNAHGSLKLNFWGETIKVTTYVEQPHPLKVYFSERWAALTRNPKISMLLWGLGAALLAVVLGFTISYFTGGMLPETFMGHLFSFMSQLFVTTIHSLAALPGLGFLGGASDATLSLIGEIVSAVMLNLAVIFTTDNLSRMIETSGVDLPELPSCAPDGEGVSSPMGDAEERADNGCFLNFLSFFCPPNLDKKGIIAGHEAYAATYVNNETYVNKEPEKEEHKNLSFSFSDSGD